MVVTPSPDDKKSAASVLPAARNMYNFNQNQCFKARSFDCLLHRNYLDTYALNRFVIQILIHMYIALAISRFDDETEFVIAVGKYLIAFLRASKCRYVAAYAALRAV